MEKISVIIPVYRAEQYLSQCVDSVLAQTYTNLEIILVDDGSPDCCGAICDEYARKDARVKVIHKKNGGVSEARNVGVDAASGEWLAFVDSDDVISHCFLEYMKRSQEICDADIVYCGCQRFSGELPDLEHFSSYESQQVEWFDREQAMENAFSIWYKPNICDKLVRRNLMAGVRFPDAKRAEDLWISYQLLSRAKKVAGMKHSNMYFYRVTSGSAMHIIQPRYIEDDMRLRMDVFQTLFQGQYKTTAKKLARQTKRIYLDFALVAKSAGDKECDLVLKRWSKELYKQMWKSEAEGLGEKFDCRVLYTSVKAWVWLQLIKHKLFKVPLYVD